MIHVKRTRLNASYFLDDYDEDKEKQDYENLSMDMIYVTRKSRMPQFFIDLLEIFPDRMNQLISDYFDFINYNTPIDADTISIEVYDGNINIPYNFVKDAEGDYETLKNKVTQCIEQWIASFLSPDMHERLSTSISANICANYNDAAINGHFDAESQNYLRTLANCLDLTGPQLIENIEQACEQPDGSNVWLDTDQKFDEAETALTTYLADTYSTEELWMACIYTRQFTHFEPDNA